MNRTRGKGRGLAAVLLLLLLVAGSILALRGAHLAFYRRAYPTGYREAVMREADKNGLPYDLVFAVIRTESGFRPEVESSVGARGLMQLTEETFEWTQSKMSGAQGETYLDLYDAQTNIRYGCRLLRLLLDEFEDEDTAMCAYHAGWGSAKRWLADEEHSPDGLRVENIPFDDTRSYVKKIAETREIYRSLYGFGQSPATES